MEFHVMQVFVKWGFNPRDTKLFSFQREKVMNRQNAYVLSLFRIFPLLLMYVIIGVLVNRYGRGIESMPELLPNYSFWADFPFLVKVIRYIQH